MNAVIPTGSGNGTANGREPLFRLRNVGKTYDMGEIQVRALAGIDLDLFGGEFVVLLGASGSGKSTLLNILGGLDRPSTGTVVYRDHDLTEADDTGLTRYRREHIGFVFQFYNLIPSLTALENVALVTEIALHPLAACARHGGFGAAQGSLSGATLRRRTTARGHRARCGQAPGHPAVRRANRRARLQHGKAGA
jgi:putative ABC transport system ATP-binding protein